mgnify:CR=1 FL=1
MTGGRLCVACVQTVDIVIDPGPQSFWVHTAWVYTVCTLCILCVTGARLYVDWELTDDD